MNNKLFRILMLFVSVCVASVSTLFAVSFSLSNSGLTNRNNELTEEVDNITDVLDDLQNTINVSPTSAVVSYEVDGKIWKIDVVEKGDSVYLPTAQDTDTHAFAGWKVSGAGDTLSGNSNQTIKENTKFVADMVEKDWLEVSLGGLASFDGNRVWTDGKNAYYSSNGYDSFILNKKNNFWEKITWKGATTNIYAFNIWTDGENTYYSNGSNQYILKENNTWETITWNGLTSFYGEGVWSNGINVYCKNEYVLNGNTWEPINWVNSVSNMVRDDIWTDGEKYYYSNRNNSIHYEIDFENNEWKEKTWEYKPNYLDGRNIWTDGTDTYYSDGASQYVLDKTANTWKEYEWQNINIHNFYYNFYGVYVFEVDNEIYHSYGKNQYKLVDGQWQNMNWGGFANFNARDNYVWSDGINTYYSNNDQQAVYDVATRSWVPMLWQGELTNFSGYYIWTDGENVYYGYQYILNKSTQTWETVDMPNGGNMGGVWRCVWTDGNNCYYSYKESQFIFDKTTKTWNKFTSWNGLTDFRGEYIWTDGENTYYSNGSNQYILKENNTWEAMTWNGLTNLNGNYIWTDGENTYYSYSSDQYILKENNTWVKKTWYGLNSFYSYNVWTDGANVYYSDGLDQYILNKNKY